MIRKSEKKTSRGPDVETLSSDPDYRLAEELSFQEMIPFVLANIRGGGIIPMVYLGINVAMAGIIIYLIVYGLLENSLNWKSLLGQSIFGIFSGSILIIPVHELIHGLVYRMMGAKRIKFGADLQQFIFYVTADRYPVSGRQLYILALAPFFVINLVLVLLAMLVFPDIILWSAFFLLSHNIMCIGDFAIVSYVNKTRGKIYSYDVTEEKKSYFYVSSVSSISCLAFLAFFSLMVK